MLTYRRVFIAVLLLLIPPTSLQGTEKTTDSHPEIERLMEITGLKQVIESLPDEIEAQINQQKISSPEAALSDEESRLLFSHFKSEAIYASLRQHLSTTLDKKEVNTLLTMHNDPLMKRIVAAEVASSSHTARREMTSFITELRRKPPSEARTKMIQQLDRAAMSTESVIHVMEMMMRGMGEMMLERSGEYSSADREQMAAVIGDTTRLVEGELRRQIIMSMHYIYRDFSDDELKRYVQQLNSSENQRYTRAAVAGIGEVIINAFKQGIDRLMLLRNARAA